MSNVINPAKRIEMMDENGEVMRQFACVIIAADWIARGNMMLAVKLSEAGHDDRAVIVSPVSGESFGGYQFRNIPEPPAMIPLDVTDWSGFWWVRCLDWTNERRELVSRVDGTGVETGSHRFEYQTLADSCQRSCDGEDWEPCQKVPK